MTQISPELTDEEEQEESEGNDLRNLRRQAKESKALKAENEALKMAGRELAFVKAGVDTDSPLGQLFFKAYDGDLTKEAITQAFAALGTAPSVEGEASIEEEIPADERGSTRERQNLGSGAAGDTGETPKTPVSGKDGEAVRAFRSAREGGGTAEEAMGAGISALINAAAQGDGSVIVRPIEQ